MFSASVYQQKDVFTIIREFDTLEWFLAYDPR